MMRDEWVLVALVLLWGGLLFGGFLFGERNESNTRRMPTWTRMASSFTLVVVAWLSYGLVMEGELARFALLIAVGMTLGFIGDLFMAQLLPLEKYVLGGMGAFGLGHVAYIAALLWMDAHLPQAGAGRGAALVFWLLIGIVGWYLIVFRGQKATALHWAALPYALLLATTTGLASGLALHSPLFLSLALGAALFLLSDLILGAHLFNGLQFPLIHDVVWLLYGPGQMLIVLSAALAVGRQT
ncbi:MAG: lysoplasmalogenase family protein [Ardenticatenaceae bacterium]